VAGAQAAAEARRANASEKAKVLGKTVSRERLAGGLQVSQQSLRRDPSHLAWLRRLDQEAPSRPATGARKVDAQAGTGERESADRPSPTAPARSWMVLHGKDFASIAKDIASFRALFAKCVSHSLGLPSDCIEVANVASGSIVVEFVLRPSGRSGDPRSASALLSLLEQQLGNPHSALRKGAFGIYVDRAELTAGEPKRAAARGHRGTRSRDQAVQTDPLDLPTPRPARKRAKEEEAELMRQIREAVKELDIARHRAAKAEAAERAALQEVEQRGTLLAELRGL